MTMATSERPRLLNDPAPLRRSRMWQKSKLYLMLLMLLLPTVALTLAFNYYPKLEQIRFSLYEWDGDAVREYVGWRNFREIFTNDPDFWQSFKLVIILLVANLFKMWPSMLTAIVLHRLRSERWQYLYRVLFVLPMVIPELVWLLIWKNFFDSTVGIFNSFLRGTGLMEVLRVGDAVMPTLAGVLLPVRQGLVDYPFGNVFGLLTLAGLVFLASDGLAGLRRRWLGVALVLLIGLWAWWGLWVYLLVLPVVAAGLGMVLNHYLPRRSQNISWWIGTVMVLVACAFIALTMIWTEPTQAFENQAPAWLGHRDLVIPAVLLWGFPWVGTVGVLIYLAGLQNISQDVYEAGEIDGCNSWHRLVYIELPLLLTQVRINLIFMTIGTLTGYGLFFILLGPSGGPGNVGMVPGLLMYRTAFIDQQFGYSCALGMILFVLILLITIVYQKYIKVDK
jgi:ABC-type sugar transport system permease subunit